MNRPDVLTLFARQHWVASTRQLAALGVSRWAVQRAKDAGLLVSPCWGVVAIAGARMSFESRALALQLCAGETAFVSGPSAGVLHGLREMPKKRLEVTMHERRRVTVPKPHRLLCTSWADEQRDVIARPDGLRVASPLRMLFGLAGQFNQHRFRRVGRGRLEAGARHPRPGC